MSLYNNLTASVICPTCKNESVVEMQVYFGLKNFLDYKIGDRVQWLPQKAVRNGGRPPDGSMLSDGYGICPVCGHDFFVPIEISNDRIVRIAHELARPGYDKRE